MARSPEFQRTLEEGEIRENKAENREAESPAQFENFEMIFEEAQDFVTEDGDPILELKAPEGGEEYEAQLEKLEDELAEKWFASAEESGQERAELLEDIMKRVMEMAKYLEVDTPGKIAAQGLEMVPYTGLLYAISGKRVKEITFSKGFEFEDIDLTERGLYVLGEMSMIPGTQALAGKFIRAETTQRVLKSGWEKAKSAYQERISSPFFKRITEAA